VHHAVAGPAEVNAVAVPTLELVVRIAGGVQGWARHGERQPCQAETSPSSSPSHPRQLPLPLPLTFAGEILLQDALSAAGAVDVSLGREQAEILAATVVHPARGQLT